MIELALVDVSFDYPGGVPALDGVDLSMAPGSSVALIGANGSGKTTLLRQLDGLLRPTRGQVLHDGVDIADRRVAELARDVALCFQHPDRQIFSRTVRDEVEFGPRRLGASYEEAFARAKDALEAVGMADELGTHPGDLGESRRKLLTIASVLAMDTGVVAIDEPTVGLDSLGVGRIETVLGTLHLDGRTTIVASHDMRFVAESSERVVLLDRGCVRLDGPPSEVFAEAAWPVLRASGLEPPEAALIGARLGVGSTPTESSLIAGLAGASPDPRGTRASRKAERPALDSPLHEGPVVVGPRLRFATRRLLDVRCGRACTMRGARERVGTSPPPGVPVTGAHGGIYR